jgi:hypothetical protein
MREVKDTLTLNEFLVMRGVYANDIFNDYQDYIERQQQHTLGESKKSKLFKRNLDMQK